MPTHVNDRSYTNISANTIIKAPGKKPGAFSIALSSVKNQPESLWMGSCGVWVIQGDGERHGQKTKNRIAIKRRSSMPGSLCRRPEWTT
jgi:hypothetical protein